MVVIGLTGGIASGKSTVSKELRSLGVPIYDADEASRQAVAKGSPALEQVAAAFGDEYLTAEGELNRPKVAELVFNDTAARAKLEGIIHKLVWKGAEDFLEQCRKEAQPLAVLDVPLLIECGWHQRVDAVWLVSVSKELQIERGLQRGGITKENLLARIEAQMSLEEKSRVANVVLDNSGSLENIIEQVRQQVRLVKDGCKN